jgi:hypothetical protein
MPRPYAGSTQIELEPEIVGGFALTLSQRLLVSHSVIPSAIAVASFFWA